MLKIILVGSFFIIFLLLMIICELNKIPAGSGIIGIIAGAILPSLKEGFQDIFDNEDWKSSQRKLERANFIRKNDKVRISFAYLFRIKINNKYFLIKNARGTGKYQPVGGVYKLYSSEAKYLKENYFIEDDNMIPVDNSSKYDYRLRLKNKYLRKFVQRFDKTVDRENIRNLVREFKEELIDTDLLNIGQFGNKLKYIYCGRHMTKLEFSKHFNCYELLLADIVEVELDEKQESIFTQLYNKVNDKYYFATSDEINSLGVKAGSDHLQEIIADHSKKILQENASSFVKNTSKELHKTFEVDII